MHRVSITALSLFFLAPCFAQSPTFVQVPGSLSQISVGADGAVWGIDPQHNIFDWDSSTSQFVQTPGQLTQIAVGNANAVWGLNAQELIFRWDAARQTWDYIPGALKQIAVGGDGDVWGVNDDSIVWHYNQQAQTWDWVGGILGPVTEIAVGNDGAAYLINNFSPGYFSPYWYNPGVGQFQPVDEPYIRVPL